MKFSPAKLLRSVRSSASKVIAKGAELKDAVVPVLTGPVKPPPTYFYCADGVTVLGPLSPDALYELVWLHETIPQDVPVCLEGTERWIPFPALEEATFSKATVKEVTRVRTERLEEKIKRDVEAEMVRQARVAEQRHVAEKEKFHQAWRRALAFSGVLLAAFIGLVVLSERSIQDIPVAEYDPASATRPARFVAAPSPSPEPSLSVQESSTPTVHSEVKTIHVTPDPTATPETRMVYGTPPPVANPRVVDAATPPVAVTAPATPDYSARTAYTNGYYRADRTWVNGYSHKPKSDASPTPTPDDTSSSTDSVYVHGYTRKNGTYVSGHSRRK